MAGAYSKSMVIQILISILLIILGLAAMYMIRRAHSEPPPITPYIRSSEPETVENPSYEEDAPIPEKRQDHGHILKPEPAKPENRVQTDRAAELAKRLENLKYVGYMRVGGAKLAWLFDGKQRIAVKEGESIDDNIKVDEIQENFLLVSDVDSHISQEIPFTSDPDSKPPSSVASASKNAVKSEAATTDQDNPAARSSGSSSPPANQYAPPSVPGDISPQVKRESGYGKTQDGNNSGTVVRMEPDLETVEGVGKTFTVQVKIDNGSNIFAIPFDINYDHDLLEVTGLYEGSYLKKDGGQTTFLTSIDKDKGKISVGMTRLGRIGGVNGSGTLMSIAFKTLKKGAASLSFSNGKPMDSRLNVLPAKFVRGKIQTR